MSNSEGSYLFNTWWQGIPITQTITSLPAGSYTLSAVLASDGATVYLIAGDDTDSYAYTETTNSGVGIVVSKDFTLTEATNFKIGAVGGEKGTAGEHKAYTADGYWWYKADNFKLVLNLDGDATIPDAIVSKLLTSVPTGTMSTSVQSALNSAVSTFENNATFDNYNALLTAISAAKTSIASYATISAGTVSTSELGNWAINTTNGALDCNTWSNEGNSDGSSMTTPFIQDWVASGTALTGGSAAGKLYYTLEGLNPGEQYNVSALVRVFNESEGDLGGASFFANSVSIDIDENGTACSGDFSTKGIYGTFNAKAVEVDEDGKLEFGIALESSSALNWIAIKNVTISEYAGQAVESITLSQSSATLTTGDGLTLTATVSPGDADDQTVTWTSSDETVATVTGTGIVAAVGAGTSTITCTANDGSGVYATCTITVTDATAPAFYSTEIANGTDYYIVNAATGKFLGGANDWGTHASIIEHGIPFTTATVSEGIYTLDSHTYNGETDHFLTGTYVDGGATNLYITSLGDGKFSISTADGSDFLSAWAGNTYVSNAGTSAEGSLAQWYFLSKSDRDKMLAAATAENPVDATYYIKEANISRNLRVAYNTSGWTGKMAYGGNNDNQCVERYKAVTDVYQEITVPNGTYKVKVQGFYRQESGDAVSYLYANDKEAALTQIFPGGINNMTGASTAFSNGEYTTELEVTVTNRTLKVGVKCDAATNWTIFDNFELYLKSYAPVTAVTAEIDKAEIQIGQTAQITAATIPATASFNAITSYTSSDESVATVDENGLVTAVAVGTAKITATAAEMENFTSNEVEVTVTLVTPTAFALSETEVALDKETTTATLTITPTPDGANTAATWVSSDETVATVADGVVTAVSTGTATITATSIIDENISAQATVTVTFPESEVPASYYTNSDATRTVYTVGENLIVNGSFEYPNSLYGWTASNDYSTAAQTSNFTITSTGGVNDGTYITGNGVGAKDAKSLTKLIPVEAGKTYYFSVYTSGKAPNSTNQGYNALFKLKSDKSEDGTITKFNWPQGADQTTTEWTKTEYTFTADDTHPYVGIRLSWAASAKFDEFVLAEVTSTTEGNVDYATAAIPTSNIGTAAFQYSQDAIDAANALVQGTATVEDVENAYTALTTLNVPEETQAYNLVFNCDGHNYTGNALTLIPNPAQTQGLYGLKYLAPANVNLAQAFYFVHTTGNKYKVFAVDTDGEDRYITTQAEGYGTTWYEGIRTINDVSKAMEIEIRPNGEGLYLLWNTGANKALAHNGTNNNDLFTNNTANFQFVETTKPSIAINTTAAGWGTVILPFAVASLPEGVKAYTCAATEGNKLTLDEVYALEANKPYLIEGAWDETVTGDAQGTALTYTEGLFTGVYAATAAPVGSYVLQKNNEKLGFYKVAEGKQPTVGANRAYLTVPAAEARDAFFFGDGETTAIQALKALTEGNAEIYDVNGVRQNTLVKGMNILKMSDGSIRKVMVK